MAAVAVAGSPLAAAVALVAARKGLVVLARGRAKVQYRQ